MSGGTGRRWRGWGLLAALAATVGVYASAFSAETPVGAVNGRVMATDTGRPMAGLDITLRPDVPESGTDIRNATTDRNGEFRLLRVPAGSYSVEVHAEVHRLDIPPIVTVEEGETAAVEARMEPGDPFLNLNIHQHAYLPGDAPRLALHGFRQGGTVNLELHAVDTVALVRDYGNDLRSLLNPVAATSRPGAFTRFRGKHLKKVRTWSHPIVKRNAEGVFYDYERLEAPDPGVYVVVARGEKTEALGWLMVTDLALVTKSAGGRVVAYAAHLKTGKPVSGARVTVFRGAKVTGSGTTNAQGLAELGVVAGQDEHEASAIAQHGTSLAFMRFNPAAYGSSDRYRVFTYTDRPVYRPGHTVRFKGVIRHLEKVGYSVPSSGLVDFEVVDPMDTVLYKDRAPLSDLGAFAAELDLPAEAQSGDYFIRTRFQGETHEDTFSVASYRKPEWRVDVSTSKPRYVRGENVPVTVKANYYYGAPVVEGQVRWTVYRSRYWSYWWDQEEEPLYDYESEFADDYGEVVAEGHGVTDEDGTLSFEFPTRLASEGEAIDNSAEYRYNVEVEVVDLSERLATGNTRVRVSSGEITLNAEPQRYVAMPGSEVPVRVRVRDLQDRPAAGIEVKMTAALRDWENGRSAEKVLTTASARSDARGELSLPVRLTETGLVAIRATATDRRGNRVEATTDIWVSRDDGGDYSANYPTLSVLLDKKQYEVGDWVQVLVNTDRPGPTALVAVESTEIHELRTVPLKSKSTVVRFRVREGYDPNVFVTACFVKDREFATNQAKVNVSPDAHRLRVTIEPDREVYRPGETATYRIRTTDVSGRPVRAELSFGVVDESVYAIREESKYGIWERFYPRRTNDVLTEFAYPPIYLGDADKAGANVAVRKNFPDTAYWNHEVVTNAEGQATLRVKMPDTLTSWRATAVAHTGSTQLGKTTANVRVMKDLTLRLQTPRVFTQGDRLKISAVAHNYSPSAQEVTVSVATQGLRLQERADRRLRLAPGQAETVTWEVRAEEPGEATVTATAVAGSLSDGMELKVPIRPFAHETVEYRTGTVADTGTSESFKVGAGLAGGELELRLAPTLAGTVLGSLDYLVTYPYGCTEQTMSSFLPDVVVLRTLRSLGLHRSELEERLPKVTQAGLLRLSGFQHYDGGWGWWEYDETDPWMTAYVMLGLTTARNSGVAINPRMYDRGRTSLAQIAQRTNLTPDDAMFVAYSLAESGSAGKARSLLSILYNPKKVAKLQIRSLGYAVLALHKMGEKERAVSVLGELWKRSIEAGGTYHWAEDRNGSYWRIPADVESTALALKAAVALTPNDERLPGVVRWLLLKRRADRWESTRDTAWILFALSDYLTQTGELKPDYHLAVRLNGRELLAEQIGPEDALKPELVVKVPVAELLRENSLQISRQGAGTAYYALRVTQQRKAEQFAPESALPGLSIQREYFRLQTRRDANGRPQVTPEDRPTLTARVGDRLLVRLTVKNKQPLEYLMIEDPLAAGCEVQDRGQVSFDEWSYWWSHMDVRDDRVSLFVRELEPGTHVLEYYLRPEQAGAMRSLPAVLEDMYVPSTRCSTSDDRLQITR